MLKSLNTTFVHAFRGQEFTCLLVNHMCSLQLKEEKYSNTSKSEERTTKMHNRDCELMGLTWLLAKNRSAYIHTVSAVLRAIMMTTDGSDPQACNLNSDGMPLAVDSSEINDQSSSNILRSSVHLLILSLSLLYDPIVSSTIF